MNLVPDWAPNIHPLLVHFPIALLYAAIAVDLVGCACWCNKPLRQAATLLYGLGAVGAIVLAREFILCCYRMLHHN